MLEKHFQRLARDASPRNTAVGWTQISKEPQLNGLLRIIGEMLNMPTDCLSSHLEQVTSELNKYQELLAQQPQRTLPTATTTPITGQDGSPQLYDSITTASNIGESPASTLDVFTLGICFGSDDSDYTAPPYLLGDQSVSRLIVAELFTEYVYIDTLLLVRC